MYDAECIYDVGINAEGVNKMLHSQNIQLIKALPLLSKSEHKNHVYHLGQLFPVKTRLR